MKTINNLLIALIIGISFVSCSKDESIDPVQRFDRNILFKIIGEFSGELKVTYTNPNNEYDVTPSEITSSLPWNKSLQYKNKVRLTGLAVYGDNGLPNEIIQLQVFSNGELIETEFGIADEQGIINAETSTIYFN